MTNMDMMKLELKRIDVCNLRKALSSIIIELKQEYEETEKEPVRHADIERCIKKWESLRAEIIRQFDEQDK